MCMCYKIYSDEYKYWGRLNFHVKFCINLLLNLNLINLIKPIHNYKF